MLDIHFRCLKTLFYAYLEPNLNIGCLNPFQFIYFSKKNGTDELAPNITFFQVQFYA